MFSQPDYMRTIHLLLLLLTALYTNAQWNPGTSVNNPVCNYAGNQTSVRIIGDDNGGAIYTWVDTRNGTQDIYAQRVDANGNLMWHVDGISICNAVSDQYAPVICSDGANGAIISWYDNREGNYDIYAQRINASGLVQWTTDGVAICNAAGNQNAQQITADGSGGAIIVWSDGRTSGANADIFAQRIDASGAFLWALNGALICNATSLQNIPQLVTDGNGGAIIAWEDWRNFSQSDIYAQRISFNGFTSWALNGIIICSEPNFAHQYNTKMVTDGAGGAIMCWQDNRNFGSGLDLYAQKVNATGTVQWINNGIAVCNASFVQTAQQIVADGSGGAIIAWEDRRTGRDIYAQKISNTGAAQWTANGFGICTTAGTQEEPQLAANNTGGAILLWTDSRNTSMDIYAQRIDASGVAGFTVNGIPVADAPQDQHAAQLIPDGNDGAIIAWEDLRTGLDFDIYTSRLQANQILPVQFISFNALRNDNDIDLTWTVENETNNAHFEIEFSTTQGSFSKIGLVNAKNTAGRHQYHFTHFSPKGAVLYYRIKQVDFDGSFAYSKVIRIETAHSQQLVVFPNPAGNFIRIRNWQAAEITAIEIISADGRIVKTTGGQSELSIADLKTGTYLLRIFKKDKTTSVAAFSKL